jgi:hypothetical protein
LWFKDNYRYNSPNETYIFFARHIHIFLKNKEAVSKGQPLFFVKERGFLGFQLYSFTKYRIVVTMKKKRAKGWGIFANWLIGVSKYYDDKGYSISIF